MIGILGNVADHAEARAIVDRLLAAAPSGSFHGLELLEPGVVPASRWRPQPGTAPDALDVYCAVGRKP